MKADQNPFWHMLGSLVGKTIEIDETSIFKQDYVRIKIGCRDVTQVPATAEGLIDDFFYDFQLEREVPVEEGPHKEKVYVESSNEKSKDLGERTPKKAKISGELKNSAPQLIVSGNNTYLKQKSSLILVTPVSKSAPAKMDSLKQREQFTKQHMDANVVVSGISGLKAGSSGHSIAQKACDTDKNNEAIDALQDLEESDDEDDLLDDDEDPKSQNMNQDTWLVECSSDMVNKEIFDQMTMKSNSRGKNQIEGLSNVVDWMDKEKESEKPSNEDFISKEVVDVGSNEACLSSKVVVAVIQAVIDKAVEMKDDECEGSLYNPETEVIIEKGKAPKSKMLLPSRASSRIQRDGSTVLEMAMKRSKKRNLEDLLNGLNKEDLIRGVEGLIQTVAMIDQAQSDNDGTRLRRAPQLLLTHTGEEEDPEDEAEDL